MAMSASSNLSPQSVAATSEVENGDVSPRNRRSNLSSPWAQVVRRGVESTEPTLSAPSSSVATPSSPPPPPAVVAEQAVSSVSSGIQKTYMENSTQDTQSDGDSDMTDGVNAGRPKKAAWSKSSLNRVVVEPSSVMGDSVSWPALSESTRPTPKSSSDPSKPVSEGGSASATQGPIISQMPPQKQVNTNSNRGMHRQRSMKNRGGGSGPGGSGSAQGGYNRHPPTPPPLPPAFPPPYVNYGNFMPPPLLDPSARGPRPTGGPRRDSDRRDVQAPPQFIPPPGGYIPPPPPPGAPPFAPLPHMRPFVGPMSFDMASPFMYVPPFPGTTLTPESFRGMPLIGQAPPAPMFFPVIDPHLPALIIKQIDYYFSDANLIKDDYLRSNMDAEGWVPIVLIANFPRVQQLTTDIQLILDSLRGSVVVEVKEQGDKIRRRNEWQKWVHTGIRDSSDSGSQALGASSDDNLHLSIEKLSLNDDGGSSSSKKLITATLDSQIEKVPDRAEESSCHSIVENGELTAEELVSSRTCLHTT